MNFTKIRIDPIIKQLAEAAIIHDKNGIITDVNPSAVKWLGTNKAKLKGTSITDLIQLDDGRKPGNFTLTHRSLNKTAVAKKYQITGNKTLYLFYAWSMLDHIKKTANEFSLECMSLYQHGQPVYLDRGLGKLTGYSQKELYGMSIVDSVNTIIHPDQRDYALKRIKTALSKNELKPIRQVIKILTKSGKTKWLDSITYVKTYDGIPTVQIQYLDITPQKLIENKLRRSENIYKTIFESTSNYIILSSPDTTIKYANKRFARLVGLKQTELQGKRSWTEFISKNDLNRMLRYHYKRRQNPKSAPKNYEFSILDKSGQAHRCLATVGMIPQSDVSVASFMDITDRIKNESLVIQANERFRIAFDYAPIGIMLVNDEYIIERINLNLAHILGAAKKDFRDVSLSSVVKKGLAPKELENISARHRMIEIKDVIFNRSDKQQVCLHILAAKIKRIQNHLGYWLIMVDDVTADWRAEKLSRELTSRVIQAHEDEKRLLSQEIHDTFSQSLAVLKMRIQELQRNGSSIHSVEVNLGIQALIDQVGELINLSRSLSHDLRPDIIDNIGFVAAIKNLTEEVEKRHRITAKLITNVLELELPNEVALQLFRITQESVVNCIKHSNSSIITIHITKTQSGLTITVKDKGIGFNTEEIGKSTFKTKSLGLKIMQERAKRIGASVIVRSKEQKGTLVIIKYPFKLLTNEVVEDPT